MGFANHAPTLGSSPHSAPLVPIFSFGENDLFDQVRNPKGSWLRQLQHRLQQIMGISLPLFHARGIFQYSFGLIPYRRPIYTVGTSFLGMPAQCWPHTASPKRDQVQFLGCVILLSGWSIMPEGRSCGDLETCWQRSIPNCSHATLVWDSGLVLSQSPGHLGCTGKAPEQTWPSHHHCGMQPTPIPMQPGDMNHCNSVGLNFSQVNFTNTSRTTPEQFAGLLSVPCRHSHKPQPFRTRTRQAV